MEQNRAVGWPHVEGFIHQPDLEPDLDAIQAAKRLDPDPLAREPSSVFRSARNSGSLPVPVLADSVEATKAANALATSSSPERSVILVACFGNLRRKRGDYGEPRLRCCG